MENAANKKAAESFDGTSDSAAFAFTANSNLMWNWKFNFLSGTERLGARRLSPPFRLRRNRPGRLPAPQGPLFGCSLNAKKATHRRTPQSGPAKTLFIFVCTRSTVLRAFGGVYGQHHHQAVQCVGAVGNVQHVGVRPVQ